MGVVEWVDWRRGMVDGGDRGGVMVEWEMSVEGNGYIDFARKWNREVDFKWKG